MDMRHEWKHELNVSDMYVLRSRLRAVCEADPHAVDGQYRIRSLYFDNLQDKALREKVDGVDRREKYRIRFYNDDHSFIRLERKIKVHDLTGKAECGITAEEAQRIVDGDIEWMSRCGNPGQATIKNDATGIAWKDDRSLLTMLYSSMKGQGIRPMTIVDYTREPFIFGPGNLRVTLDYNVRTGLRCTDFLNPEAVTVPVPETFDKIILEVKWDEYLPNIIRDLVQLPGRRTEGYSKYEACRMYG